MILLDGKKCANNRLEVLKQKVLSTKKTIGIAFILVGDDKASHIYVNMKKKACLKVGIKSTVLQLPATVSQQELLASIDAYNKNPDIHGILVQQPLPSHLDTAAVIHAVCPTKDVDGFHPLNLGKLTSGDPSGFIPCTPLGILNLLDYYNISIRGKHVVIVGRSLIVGRPLALLLSQKKPHLNATVTLMHSQSEHKRAIMNSADILVACAGSKRLIQEVDVKQGAVVIDVGIHREVSDKSCRIVGDVDFENVQAKCHAISPVPGGVGPMTIVSLLENTALSFERS